MKRVFVVEISIQATLMGSALLVTIVAWRHYKVSNMAGYQKCTDYKGIQYCISLDHIGYRKDLVNMDAGPNRFSSLVITLNVGGFF